MVALLSAIFTWHVVLLLIWYPWSNILGEDSIRGKCMEHFYGNSTHFIAQIPNVSTLPVSKYIYLLQIF